MNSGHPGCVWQRLSSDQLECAGFHREGRNGTIKAGAPWDAGSTVNSQPIKSNWLCSGLIVSYTACIGSSSTVIALQRGQESEGSAVTAQDMGSRHVSKKKNRRSGGSEMKRERKEKKKREKKIKPEPARMRDEAKNLVSHSLAFIIEGEKEAYLTGSKWLKQS